LVNRHFLRQAALWLSLIGCWGGSAGMTQAAGLIPNSTLHISASMGVPLEKIVFWGAYAGAAYLILDPLAPNWEIEQAPLPEDHVHIALKMRRFYAGGAGEARQLFQRRARELVQYGSFSGYEIQEYSEGIESSLIGSQRVARGVIHLTGKRDDQGKDEAGAANVDNADNAPPARNTSASATNPRS
jgi:hypothetical protein